MNIDNLTEIRTFVYIMITQNKTQSYQELRILDSIPVTKQTSIKKGFI